MKILNASLLFAFTAAAACNDDDDDRLPPDDGGSQTVVDVAREAGEFDTLLGALESTGLDRSLSAEGPFTVFAPTDDAFARLPAGMLEDLDPDTLSRILSYHVSAGQVPAATVVTLDEAATLAGASIDIQLAGDGTVILDGTVQVVQTDLRADNGIIHVIDAVLLPPDVGFPGTLADAVLAYPIFDTLAGAAARADLVGALADEGAGGLTLFAPTEQAFAALGVDLATLNDDELADVLLYHVVGEALPSSAIVDRDQVTTLAGSPIDIEVEDGSVVLNGESTVTWTDVDTDSGVLHVIDTVLLPPG
jgi:transforming growth factor-beta-induced protein